MSHSIHYIMISEYTGAPQEELSCEAAAAIEPSRNIVFDYLEESPVDENGDYLKTLSYREDPQAFMSLLAEIQNELTAMCRMKLELLADSLGIAAGHDPGSLAVETGRELFRRVHEGMSGMEQGTGNEFLPQDIAWNLKTFSLLVCGEYTFDSGFFDAVRRYKAIVPCRQDILDLVKEMAEDMDLYLVPLDLHF